MKPADAVGEGNSLFGVGFVGEVDGDAAEELSLAGEAVLPGLDALPLDLLSTGDDKNCE